MARANPQDVQAELAKERNRIAADRTLLAWVRTSVSFIGLGFGMSQILSVLAGVIERPQAAVVLDEILSLLFIGLGVFIAIAAALDYQKELSQLRQANYLYRSRPSLGLIVGGIVAIASIIAFVLIFHGPLLP